MVSLRRVFSRFIMAVFISLVISSCVTGAPAPVAEPGLSHADSALLQIYRPSQFFHAANPESPFVYVGDQLVGNLRVGAMLQYRVRPGSHVVVLRQSLLFMPAYEIGRVEITSEAGKTYYVRYSYDMTGIVGTYPQGRSSLHQVDQQTGGLLR